MWFESPHFWHLSLFLYTFLVSKLFWSAILPVTCVILVTGWSRLNKGLPLLVLAWWEVCALMSHQIDLSHLGSLATCLMHLVVAFELSILYTSCLILFVGNMSRSILLSLIVLETNSSSLRKNQKMPLWSILAVSWRYLAKVTWVCTALYHSSTDLSCWSL